jgi:hypothetical protein
MNKKELEQKLIEVNAQLKALGDLNALVQQSQNLPNLINDAQLKKQQVETFLNDLPTRSEKINQLTAEVEKLNEQLTTRNTEVSELSKQTEELQKKVGELVEETKVQLGVAANAKLASTFEQVKGDLTEDKWRWFHWLVGAVVVLIIATASIVAWQIIDVGTLYELNFLVKLALTSPFVYFVVFINREYSRTRSLIEEYTFKAAIARSFEAYKEIIQDTDSDDATKTLEFVIKSIADLYSSPMVNIKNNALKEKDNSPDILSRARSVVDDVINHDQKT